jgi:hypothetical protein
MAVAATTRAAGCADASMEAINKRTPTALDMVNDRVYSRLLSCLVFILVLAHVFRFVALSFFLTTPGTLKVKNAALFRYPATETRRIRSGEVGQKLWPSIGVEVLTQSGEPVGNVSVTAQIQLVGMINNLCINTTLDHSGVFLGVHDRDQFSPFAPPKVYQSPVLSGNTVRTSSDGLADFRNLRINSLVAGEGSFVVSFTAETTASPANSTSATLTSTLGPNAMDQIIYTVTQTTQVDQIQLLHRIHPTAMVNEPLRTQPILLVLDSNNRPVTGVRCKAITIIPLGNEWTVPSWGNEALRVSQVLLGNVTSLPSDSNGYAFFESLHIRASALERVHIEYACDGKVGMQNDKLAMATARAPSGRQLPATLTITQQPSTVVQEGQPFEQAPVVRVVDADGLGMEGVRVMGHLKMEAGVTTDYSLGPNSLNEAQFASKRAGNKLLGQAKRLQNFISRASDADGYARFDAAGDDDSNQDADTPTTEHEPPPIVSSLRFSQAGPAGRYSIIFSSNGIFTENATEIIDVTSSVHVVLLELAWPDTSAPSITMFDDGAERMRWSVENWFMRTGVANTVNNLLSSVLPFNQSGLLPAATLMVRASNTYKCLSRIYMPCTSTLGDHAPVAAPILT